MKKKDMATTGNTNLQVQTLNKKPVREGKRITVPVDRLETVIKKILKKTIESLKK